jgi:RNA-binding protein YlmH
MDKLDSGIVHRFEDLAMQADRKGIVLFSDFLNLNEINLLHQYKDTLVTQVSLSGGYEPAERQVAAFIPDALYYDWDYPIACIKLRPVNARFMDELSHRDVLGALMHLGIDRGVIGDILVQDRLIYVFCLENMAEYICQSLSKIKHTMMLSEIAEPKDLQITVSFEECEGQIASNRLDAFVAQVCHLSRGQAADYILGENVFVNGKMISNHNYSLTPGCILSLRGYGKCQFVDFLGKTKKGKLRIRYRWYR